MKWKQHPRQHLAPPSDIFSSRTSLELSFCSAKMMESLMKWDNMLAVVFAVILGYLSNGLLTRIVAVCQGRGVLLYSTLQGKHVVITGGSSGIGYAIALHALVEGASVTLIARNVDKLQQAKASLIREINCLPGAIHVKSADVSDAASITAAIRAAQERMPIDVLVCNAGVVFPGHFDEVLTAELEDTVRVNILGSVYPIHAAIPLMKSRCSPNTPQSILLISSLAGLHQCYGANVYASTKYAQRGLAENLRWELLPYNIHMHVVCPGFVDTPMLQVGEDPELAKLSQKMNFFELQQVATSSDVAKCTWEGVKRGRFLITTNWVGHLAAAVSRGPIPEDSIATNLWELLLVVPIRLLSFVVKRSMARTTIMQRHVTVPASS